MTYLLTPLTEKNRGNRKYVKRMLYLKKYICLQCCLLVVTLLLLGNLGIKGAAWGSSTWMIATLISRYLWVLCGLRQEPGIAPVPCPFHCVPQSRRVAGQQSSGLAGRTLGINVSRRVLPNLWAMRVFLHSVHFRRLVQWTAVNVWLLQDLVTGRALNESSWTPFRLKVNLEHYVAVLV